MKTKYIETSPLKRELIFNNSSEYYAFYDQYFNEIFRQVEAINPQVAKTDLPKLFELQKKFWIYNVFKIKKSGEPGKIHPYPKWFDTAKAKENQKKNWRAFLEKKKQEQEKARAYLKEQEENIKVMLREKGIDTTKLNIKITSKK